MMECKQALTETGGDMEAAADLLRKRAGAKVEKKSGRTAAEGVIGLSLSADRKLGAIAEVNCETDFVAKGDNFSEFANAVAAAAATGDPAGIHYAPRVVDPENAWIMNSMLRDVIQYGTARRAQELKRKDLSGKTGTTNDQRDAWFSGFNSEVAAVAWVGFDKFLPLGNQETGGQAALPMWMEYMRVALEGIPESIIKEPPGLVFARIDPYTGKPAPPGSPDAIFEVFSSKNTPEEVLENRPGSGNDSNVPEMQDIF